MLCKMAFDPLKMENFVPELREDKEHSIKECFVPRAHSLSSGTYPGAPLPISLAPSLLTPLTAALKIPNPSLEQKLTQSMGPVVLMQHEEPPRHDLGSSSSK